MSVPIGSVLPADDPFPLWFDSDVLVVLKGRLAS